MPRLAQVRQALRLDISRRRVLGAWPSLGIWALLALVAWLDTDRCAWSLRPALEIHQAHVFSLIVAGIQVLAGWLSTAATVTVTYLAHAVAWLGVRVASILKSTGAMFAKVWDASKIVWSDVLKPALHWLNTQLTRLHAWLKQTFQPVFKWLQRVRDELNAIYKRFVRPIIDTIEFIRAISRVLLVFNVKALQQLDAVLQKIEQRVEEPFLWISVRLTQIQNFLDQILTLGGLFQRLTLIRSLERYWPDWARIAVNSRARPVTEADFERVREKGKPPKIDAIVTATAAAVTGQPGAYESFVDEFAREWRTKIEAAQDVTGQAVRIG